MASSKEIQHPSRPLGQRRLSMTTASLPKSNSRVHPHSTSTGSLISNHRVTRRKSVSTNNAVMVAAVRDIAEFPQGIPIVGRRSNMSKGTSARSNNLESLPSPPMSLPTQKTRLNPNFGSKIDMSESAIEDDQMDDTGDEDDGGPESKRDFTRRASDSQNDTKDGKKPSSNDLKCDKCGKGYKHSSCLSKHLWEHTPEWSYTSKLLISKHQQVQLLEAASVLLTMTQDINTSPQSARDIQSDHESASPAASGSSERNDHLSSINTTPSPRADKDNQCLRSLYSSRYKRQNNGNSFSQSQLAASPTTFLRSRSVPHVSLVGNRGKYSTERSSPSSSLNNGNHEDESLASAVQLLSCSFGNTAPLEPSSILLPEQIPSVPDIPPQYLGHRNIFRPTFIPGQHPSQPESYTRTQAYNDEDVNMESEESATDDDDCDQRSPGRSDEDEDGVFGRME
ncbi:C2H2 finger domain protein [Blumeria hordei DH14]|uniref:C2H2 finger domain protein n=1 Tax=Blumeria graminis f. sp. hordei (strain DH14) TaxID=546991 RepID=N1JKF2_BLUG1|nr:C2H2 finger domain protein [Blumeria hordei DH14]